MRVRLVIFRRYVHRWIVLLFISMVLFNVAAGCIAVTGMREQVANKLPGSGTADDSGIFKASFANMIFSDFIQEINNINLLVMAGSLALILILIFLFSMRLKKLKIALGLKDKEIGEIKGSQTHLAEGNNPHNIISDNEDFNQAGFYRKLIDSAGDSISFHDTEGTFKFANPAYYNVIGVEKEEYDRVPPESYLHPEDIAFNEKRIIGLKENGYYNDEIRLKHKDGHYVTLSTRSVVVKDNRGTIIGSLCVSRDDVSLKLVQNELIKAKVDAEISYKLKSSFLANISHEVRTPLNSVVGFSNLLMAEDLTDDVKLEYIENINASSEKLLQIIGDIIDLSRLESSQMEITYEEASINDIVGGVISEARKLIKRNEKPIILSVRKELKDADDMVFTDQIWMKRVLNHLMDNAIKFTLEGSVEFWYSREGDNLIFKIKDTGIGINKDNLGYIFDEFRQEIDGHKRPFEGLGIGLTLSREFVKRMGGKISVTSEKGVGSEFLITIPFRPALSGTIKSKPTGNKEQYTDWRFRKCLLVDDNRDVLTYLKRILLDTGIEIVTARSGKEAISFIKNDPLVDVVILDLQMPEMNGAEAAKEIREMRKDIPIIAQTEHPFDNEKDIIFETGCDACLLKPIRKDLLVNALSNFIR